MSALVDPQRVIDELVLAGIHLSAAHAAAAEQEDDRADLIGPTRDMIFGLNSSVAALVDLIEQASESA
jgi:hypothetical protein